MCLLFGEIGKKEVFTSYMRQMQFCSINFEVKAKEFAIAGTTITKYLTPWLFTFTGGRFQIKWTFPERSLVEISRD